MNIWIYKTAPGHSFSWGYGYPEIISQCPYSDNSDVALTPANSNTLPFIQTLYSEAIKVFGTSMFHGGGDEVEQDCWSSDPAVVAWMKENNMTTNDVYQMFISFQEKTIVDNGAAAIFWEDVSVDFVLFLFVLL